MDFYNIELDITSPFILPTSAVTNEFNRPNVRHVLPNLDAKIGLEYTYCFCNRSSITAEIGYQTSEYWNAFNLIRGDVTTVAATPAQRFTAIETTSFAVQGPYLSLTYHL